MTKHRHHQGFTPCEVATNPNPIDIIMLGYREADAVNIGATAAYIPYQCMFVDCDETIFVSPIQNGAAEDLYLGRESIADHADDQILACCRQHRKEINNPLAVVGIDIYDAVKEVRGS